MKMCVRIVFVIVHVTCMRKFYSPLIKFFALILESRSCVNCIKSFSHLFDIKFLFFQMIVRYSRRRSNGLTRRITNVLPCAAYVSQIRSYNVGPFKNPMRRPQLTDEERSKVVVNQAEWPREFKDYDPENPYKYSPDWIEGLSSVSIFLLGVEVAFIMTFLDLVFPYSI